MFSRAALTRAGLLTVSAFLFALPAFGGPSEQSTSTASGRLDLQSAVALALENNFGIAIRRLEKASAKEDVAIARAFYEPVFAATATRNTAASYEGIPAGDFTGYSASISERIPTGGTISIVGNTSRNDFGFNTEEYYSDVHINLRQPLLRGGGFTYNRSPIELGKLTVSESDYELRRSVLDLLRNVEIAYWEVVYANRARDVRQQTVNVAERLLRETQERGNVGLATGVEPLQAEAALVGRLEELITSRQAIEDRTDRLMQLMGKLGQARYSVELPAALPTVVNPRIDDAQLTAYIHALPDYRLFDSVLARRRIYVQRARNEALPIIDVAVGTGYTGFGNGYTNAFSQAFRNDQRDYQALLEMRIPLGFGQERANLRKRKYELQIDELRKRDFEQQLRAQIREEARAVVAGNERVRVTESLLTLNNEQYEQLQAKFQEGLTNFREMLLVQDDLREANIRAERAKLDALAARIRLARYDGSLLERYGLQWDVPRKSEAAVSTRTSFSK